MKKYQSILHFKRTSSTDYNGHWLSRTDSETPVEYVIGSTLVERKYYKEKRSFLNSIFGSFLVHLQVRYFFVNKFP